MSCAERRGCGAVGWGGAVGEGSEREEERGEGRRERKRGRREGRWGVRAVSMSCCGSAVHSSFALR